MTPNEQPTGGIEVPVFIPDWLGRQLLKEAIESGIAAKVATPSLPDFIVAILVWREMDRDPEFVKAVEKGEEDLRMGRFRKWKP